MNNWVRWAIVLVVVAAVGGVLAVKVSRAPASGESGPADAWVQAPQRLPRLVDLGASKCIPCKAMAPILAELRQTYEGRLKVEFIDVWENREAAVQYAIRSIPTQIFYDADGKELFRHEGFIGREQILAKWAELGFEFGKAGGEGA